MHRQSEDDGQELGGAICVRVEGRRDGRATERARRILRALTPGGDALLAIDVAAI